MELEIITSLIGFLLGGGGVWSYFKSQNDKIENILTKRVNALEKSLIETKNQLKEANRKIEIHESNLLVILSSYKTLTNIARQCYDGLGEDMKQDLIKAETKVDSIISIFESRNNNSF